MWGQSRFQPTLAASATVPYRRAQDVASDNLRDLELEAIIETTLVLILKIFFRQCIIG